MKGFDLLQIKPAVKGMNSMPRRHEHVTTIDFGQLLPLLTLRLVPRDEINVRYTLFNRLSALVKPVYGNAFQKSITAFVPLHQIAEDAEAYLAGQSTYMGQPCGQRYITAETIVKLFCNGNIGGYISTNPYLKSGVTSVTAPASYTQNYDFVVYGSGSQGNAYTYYSYSPLGKYIIKVLNCLGYQMPGKIDITSNSWWNTTGKSKKFNAYPLLAYFKVYNDWFSQPQRYNSSQASSLLLNIRQNKAVTNQYSSSTFEILYQGLIVLFDNLYINYENDYFTSAWQNPNAPIGSQNQVGPSPNVGNIVVSSLPGDNFILDSSSSNLNPLYQRALDYLKAFDSWVRRNNYSGSREVQKIYSRFGIKTDDFQTHYSHVLKKPDVIPLQVGDVTSQADTYTSSSGARLGDYAGKGIISGESSSSYKSSDYGYFFVLAWCTVQPSNPFGYSRDVLSISPYDFYQPEFDGLGAEAISAGEVFVNAKIDPLNTNYNESNVFGYTERYNSYKANVTNMVSGDFRIGTNTLYPEAIASPDSMVWHFGRDLTSVVKSGNLVAQNSNVNQMDRVGSEWDRIFSAPLQGEYDHFNLDANFDINLVRPMLSANEATRLGVGNLQVERNGNVIN